MDKAGIYYGMKGPAVKRRAVGRKKGIDPTLPTESLAIPKVQVKRKGKKKKRIMPRNAEAALDFLNFATHQNLSNCDNTTPDGTETLELSKSTEVLATSQAAVRIAETEESTPRKKNLKMFTTQDEYELENDIYHVPIGFHSVCGECGLQFMKRDPYINHVRLYHMLNVKTISCLFPECNRKFLYKSVMEKHVRQVHYNCKFLRCKHGFLNSNDLKVHSSTHATPAWMAIEQ